MVGQEGSRVRPVRAFYTTQILANCAILFAGKSPHLITVNDSGQRRIFIILAITGELLMEHSCTETVAREIRHFRPAELHRRRRRGVIFDGRVRLLLPTGRCRSCNLSASTTSQNGSPAEIYGHCDVSWEVTTHRNNEERENMIHELLF
jgi:hypothetical protein